MKLKKGSKTAIIGESGSGKTTITKLLMRFYEPEKGSININGINIGNYSLSSLRGKIAYVSQDTFFFSDNIYENLRMGKEDISDEEIVKMCKYCYADEFIEKLPFGYYTVLEENASNLSNGQKQRLAIARALLKKPDILILDEATSNLDSLTEHSISKTINEISSNITCIIIAHRLYTIKNSDYIYVLKNGKIAEEGTHNMLMEQEGLYSAFWKENELGIE
jgi:ATP-binding cassette subfamily B protein